MPYETGTHPNSQIAIRDPQAQALALKRSQQARSARAKLNALVDYKCGDGGEEALDVIIEIMRGNLTAPSRKPTPGEDLASYAALVPQVGPTLRERLDAAMWIQEHRNGKPRQTLDVSGEGVTVAVVPVNLGVYSDQELEIAEMLLEKGTAPTIEGEFTTVEPVKP